MLFYLPLHDIFSLSFIGIALKRIRDKFLVLNTKGM